MAKLSANKRVLLVDNGSLEPASTLQLRRIAAALRESVGVGVEPVSLAHSTKVAVDELEGRPAELFETALDRVIEEGVREIVVSPLFIGPSYAIARHLTAVVEKRIQQTRALRVKIAPPLFVPEEKRLARILADHVRAQAHSPSCRVAVVDHGSPSRAVTEVRDRVAEQVRDLLAGEVADVCACSMERRAGDEFAFNEPLLENLLAREEWREGALVVALLFIAPGKHAGPEGDVAQIVARARAGLAHVRFTPVMGAHPLLIDVLADRVREAERGREWKRSYTNVS